MEYLKAIAGLLFVLGLVGVSSWLGRKYLQQGGRLMPAKNSVNRLKLCDQLLLTPKQRLVVVEYASEEWLLLLSGDQASVVTHRAKAEGAV
jgi:flagellar biogenesis protein FliO